MPRLTRPAFVGLCLSFALFLTARAFGDVAMAATGPCDSLEAPTTTVYLPNITKTLGGPSGWVTPFYVQNSGAIQTTVEASFYRFRDGVHTITCHD